VGRDNTFWGLGFEYGITSNVKSGLCRLFFWGGLLIDVDSSVKHTQSSGHISCMPSNVGVAFPKKKYQLLVLHDISRTVANLSVLK
jgi:hypothetical protein